MLNIHPEFPVTLVLDPDAAAPRRAASPNAEASVLAESWTDLTGCDYGSCVEDGGEYHVHIYGLGSFIFSRHSSLVRGAPEPDVPPAAFQNAFYRELLPLVLHCHSWEVLHASGLVVGGECVALCGASRRGKSTLAHAWRRRGGHAFADDAIPFRMEGGSAHLHPIPYRIRLRSLSLRYFGLVPESAEGPLAGSLFEMAPGGRLRSIYLLERRPAEHGAVVLEPLSSEAALPALLRQAYCLTLRDRARNRTMMESYIALVNAVPTFQLSYPTGLHHVDLILDHLAAHGTGLGRRAG